MQWRLPANFLFLRQIILRIGHRGHTIYKLTAACWRLRSSSSVVILMRTINSISWCFEPLSRYFSIRFFHEVSWSFRHLFSSATQAYVHSLPLFIHQMTYDAFIPMLSFVHTLDSYLLPTSFRRKVLPFIHTLSMHKCNRNNCTQKHFCQEHITNTPLKSFETSIK